MRPRRVRGLTDEQRERRCAGKHRWSDELSARAGAIHSLETYGGPPKLWTYKCPHCAGWHLTRAWQRGQEPITLEKQI